MKTRTPIAHTVTTTTMAHTSVPMHRSRLLAGTSRRQRTDALTYRRTFPLLALTLLLCLTTWAAPPDATKDYIDISATYNLGPTGAKGWIYTVGSEWAFNPEAMTYESRQILITAIDAGSPATNLQIDDVIMGTGSVDFASDARIEFGKAIGEAEKTTGNLYLKVWRAGVTNNNLLVKLPVMGAYSATAPYNCPKSALILSNALNYLSSKTFNASAVGNAILGMALLAGGRTQDLPKVQTYARAIAPNYTNLLSPAVAQQDLNAMVAWDRGYNAMFLSEYYMVTNDPVVWRGLTTLVTRCAVGQSKYGLYGHGMAWPKPDWSDPHGIIAPYGALNQAGMMCAIGIILGERCGITNAEIYQGIERPRKYFGQFAGKGAIPYGEDPSEPLHDDNGKNGLGTLLLALQTHADMRTQVQWFAKSCVASYGVRNFGHSEAWWGQIWPPLAANLGGTNAMAGYMNAISWEMDLARRPDGSFAYNHFGGGTLTAGPMGLESDTAKFVLTYATALQKIYITGKNASTNNWISTNDVNEAVADGKLTLAYDVKAMTTNQLLAALSTWSPYKRYLVSKELPQRPGSNTVLMSTLMKMAEGTNVNERMGATHALVLIDATNALPVLARRLYDSDYHVRFLAAGGWYDGGNALLHKNTAQPILTNMLMAIISNEVPYSPIDWNEPIQAAQTYLGFAIFNGQIANSLTVAGVPTPTNLLYPAIATMTRAHQKGRAGLNGFFSGNALQTNDVVALAPTLTWTLMDGFTYPDCSTASSVLDLLAKHYYEEGMAAAMLFTRIELDRSHLDFNKVEAALQRYRAAASATLPELNYWNTTNIPLPPAEALHDGALADTISVIQSDPGPPPTLRYFKKITAATASQTTLYLPATNISFSIAGTTIANDALAYGWKKGLGLGTVTFSANYTAASSNTVATFSMPGTYIIGGAVADNTIGDGTNCYGAVFTNFTILVYNSTNSVPVPVNQALTTAYNTARAVTLSATDANGDPLTYSVVGAPANGSVTGVAPNVVYVPTGGYSGYDSFTFKANDGKVDSTLGTITIDVNISGANRRPVASNQVVSTVEDTPKAITLTGSDPNANPLTYAIVNGPGNGTVTGVAPSVVYLPGTNFPASNFNGTDSFTFVVRDNATPALTSGVAIVNITVTPVNDLPVANPQTVVLAEQESGRAITLTGSDPEGYPLTYVMVSYPATGTLYGTAPNLTYSAPANYFGTNTFQFKVMDTEGLTSLAATVTLVITNVNDSPTAMGRSTIVFTNKAMAIQLTATDADNDPLTYTLLTTPAYGMVTGTAPKVVYIPATNYFGMDSFTFKVNDGKMDSTNNATVYLNVGGMTTNIYSEYFQPVYDWPSDMGSLTPYTTRIDQQMSLTASQFPAGFQDHFCSRHIAFLNITTSGYYTFTSGADDDTRVYINEMMVINQVFPYSGSSAPLWLEKGYHGIKTEFKESYGDNYFSVSWSGPGIGGTIPASAFVRSRNSALPTAPTGLVATPGNALITLDWAAVARADGYNVKRALVPGGPYTTVGTNVPATTYTDTPLVNGTTYYYVVAATNSVGQGLNSTEAYAMPSVISVMNVNYFGGAAFMDGYASGDAAARGSASQVAPLAYSGTKWNDIGIAGATSCNLTNATGTATGFLLTSLGSQSFSDWTGLGSAQMLRSAMFGNYPSYTTLATVSNLTAGHLYYLYVASLHNNNDQSTDFRVGATVKNVRNYPTGASDWIEGRNYARFTGLGPDSAGRIIIEGKRSGEMVLNGFQLVDMGVQPPTTPAGLAAVGANAQVLLNWTAAAGATGYKVKRSLSFDGVYTQVGTAGTTNFTDFSVLNRTTYYYRVSATNAVGESSNSGWTSAMPFAPPAFVDITNLTGAIVVTNATQYIAGTNDPLVAGGMRWTNSLGGGGTVTRAGLAWNCTATLNPGNNLITINATNIAGDVVGDSVTVYRAVAPYVDITNADFTVAMDVTTVTIGGTNNAGPVGFMTLESRTGAVVNYTASLDATTPWIMVVSNIVPGATNFLTMTVTNILGAAANDTVQIYRNPAPVIDITNIAGTVIVPGTATGQYVAGVNNPQVVGGMTWTNSSGDGGTLDPAPGAWSFTAPLAMGYNLITVSGTNNTGYVVSDAVTVYRSTPVINMDYSIGMDGTAWTNVSWGGSATHAAPIQYIGSTWNYGDQGNIAISVLSNSDGTVMSPPIGVSAVYPQHAGWTDWIGFGNGDNGTKLCRGGCIVWLMPGGLFQNAYRPLFTLTGLLTNHTYDLTFAGKKDNIDIIVWYKYGNQEVSATNNATGDPTDWTLGKSYVTLTNLVPRANGEIMIEARLGDTGYGNVPLNGWQLEDNGLNPQPNWSADIVAFGYAATSIWGTISGTNISLLMPYDYDLTTFAPDFDISVGATCSPAQGVPTNFTAGPVTYTVVSENLATTNQYLATVTTSSYPVTINVNYHDGSKPVDGLYSMTPFNSRTATSLAPAGYNGTVWNDQTFATRDVAGGTPGVNGLRNSVGEFTGIGLTTPYITACHSDWGPAGLGLWLVDGSANGPTSADFTNVIVLASMDPMRRYDLYIARQHYWNTRTTVFQVNGRCATNIMNNPINVGGWADGTNYVVLADVQANESGTLAVQYKDVNECGFNAFQLVDKGIALIVNITNITGTVTVTNDVASQYIAGYNSPIAVGWLTWTNSLGGGGAIDAALLSWNFSAPLTPGFNVISVSGTNTAGELATDTVTVVRAITPVLDITNANFSVGITTTMIGGTNNAGPVGFMTLVSQTVGATTNFTASIPATSPWTIAVSNLVPNTTNFVTMTATNGMGVAASDTVQVFCRPLACIDITNVSGFVLTTNAVQYIAGTNDPFIVGGMWWTNSLGGGGTLVPGNWNFIANLAYGNNVITVNGTNSLGDPASDSVTIVRADQGPVTNGMIVWVKADAVDTGDTTNQVRIVGTNTYVMQWNDQSGYGHNASNVTVADQPQYILGGLNGKPVLRFAQDDDDNGDRLYLGDLSAHTPGSGTVFAVATINNDGRYNLFGNRNNDERWKANSWNESKPGSFRTARSDTFAYNSWPWSNSHVFVLQNGAGAAFSVALDGTNIGSDTANYHNGSGQNWTIGNRSVNGQQLRGDIAEMVIYDRILSLNEANQMGRYLSDKYELKTAYPGELPKANILSFGTPGLPASITGTNIAWTVLYGTAVTNLAPVFTLSEGATCNKVSGSTNDFTSPVTYTVWSTSNILSNVFTVTVTVAPASAAKDMLTFGLPGLPATIVGTNVNWTLPYGFNPASLAPTYSVSIFASANPPSGSTQDFTGPVTYTVTAQDLSTKEYVVTVTSAPSAGVTINMNIYGGSKPGNADMDGVYSIHTIARGSASRVAPRAYDGNKWNDYQTSSGANMLNSTGAVTTVGFIATMGGGPWNDWTGLGVNRLLVSGLIATYPTYTTMLTLTNLDVQNTYDLYIASQHNSLNRNTDFQIGSSTVNVSYVGATDWVAGQSYAYFGSLKPAANGTIAVNAKTPTGELLLNGFQLVDNGPLRAFVDITNIAGTITVPTATTSQYIAGTNNNLVVGMMTWTNSAGGGGTLDPAPGTWNFTPTLQPGPNVISVIGTNFAGIAAGDSVTVIRAIAPFVNITNADFTVGMNTAQTIIGGTNNAGPVGRMTLVSMTGTTTNYAASIVAATPWTVMISNLVADATNVVTMTVTNGVGVSSSDTVQIYRRPLAVVDITNVVGTIVTTNATQYIAGTNNPLVVGGMWWTNSAGGAGGKFPASSSTGWSFTVTLLAGTNIITVSGTNTIGEVASDAVTNAPPSSANDILTCTFGALGNAFISGTNINMTVPFNQQVTNLAPSFAVSPFATINPASGTAKDFTTPQTYIVTAQNGVSNKAYLVTVTALSFKYVGSLFVLTTPEGANLPASALETNFPLLVRFNSNNFVFGQAQTNGADIRFSTPSGVPLSYQIEEWDAANGTASVWVRLPFVAGNARQEFKMYWGNTNVTSESSATNVFNVDNTFASAIHLDPTLQDAVGTLSPVNSGSTSSQGIIGKGRSMVAGTGVNGGSSITNYPYSGNPWTTTVWLKPDAFGACAFHWGRYATRYDGSGAGNEIDINVESPASINWASDGGGGSTATTVPVVGEWYYVAVTYENQTNKIFVNGKMEASGTGRMSIFTNVMMTIGGLRGSYQFDGQIDEVRVARLARSTNWIKLEYENQKILQTAVGSLVPTGSAFSTLPTSITMNEGSTTNLTAQAGGAQKVYWIYRKDGVDTLLAVDQLSLSYNAGRVVDSQSFSLQFRAVYPTEVKTNDIPVTVTETIPDPVFTLTPSTFLWDGRTVMTVKTNISNWSALLALGATNLNYSWNVAGVAVAKTITPGMMVLTRALGSGLMTVNLVLDNGGAKISNSVVVTVQEPTNEAWIVRTPGTNEIPVHNQFYARDNTGFGSLYYNGSIGGSPDTVFITVYTNGGGADVVYTNVSQAPSFGSYALAARIPAGLITHKVEFGSVIGTTTNILNTVTNIVCGDAYIADGQSNAEATGPNNGTPPESNYYRSSWIRSYGNYSGSTNAGWGEAWRTWQWGNPNYGNWQIGTWEMVLASNIVNKHKMPVCIIMGAVGGTRIDVHQRNDANHTDGSTIYGRLLNRVQAAKLTHGIRGFLWHQGENNSGSDGPDGDWDYKFYKQYFVDMSADWKEDCPNLIYNYVYQIWPLPCSMGPKDDEIRDVQRMLPYMYSKLRVMSTIGITTGGRGTCHFDLDGYAQMGMFMSPMLELDTYGLTNASAYTAPDVKRVYFTSTNRTVIAMDFGQNMAWTNAAAGQIYLDDSVGGQIASGSVAGATIRLYLTVASTNTTITYLHGAIWDGTQGKLIKGSNGIAALTFANVPIEPAPSTTNLPSDVQLFVAARGADYGQVQLSWSNGAITVLACTNRLYSTNDADWFVLSSGVSTPWTHSAASNFPSVYYRIVSGTYTSQYAVGKYDINIAPGSIAWLSFPFGVQPGCDIVAEWFGQQLEARYNSAYDFPSLQRQSTPGGTIEYSDYYIADLGNGSTNWFPTNSVVANAGYVLFLPQDHGAVKVTGIGMVQTNNVTMQLPYNSIPWVGLAYDVIMDMRQSGLTNMLQPPRLYSTFNYDFVDSQQTPGGPIWYAEYYQDNWGGNTINFFPSANGADKLEPGKGYLLFFSTTRGTGTGTWTCVKPY